MLDNLKKYHIILASNSPRRRELLSGLGVDYEVRTLPGVDESYPDTLSGEDIPVYISREKAAAYLPSIAPDELIITADTIVWLDGRVLGKPADEADACRMLRMLSGNTHMVYTGVTVIDTGTQTVLAHFAEGTKVSLYPLPEAWIQRYVDTGEPMDKAGAYAIQGGCMPFIRGLEGEYMNVVGFPAARFYQELLKKGIDLLDATEEEET